MHDWSTCPKLTLHVFVVATYLPSCLNKTEFRCNVLIKERPRNDVSDGISWWCRTCKGRKSIRCDSFFTKSRLALQKWMLGMHWWANEYPVGDMAKEAEIRLLMSIGGFVR